MSIDIVTFAEFQCILLQQAVDESMNITNVRELCQFMIERTPLLGWGTDYDHYLSLQVFNITIELILQRDLLFVCDDMSVKSYVGVLKHMFENAPDEIRYRRKQSILHPTRWMHEMIARASEEVVIRIGRILLMSSSLESYVVEYQNRVTQVKIAESLQSPIFEELTRRFTNPINFTNGWFEKMQLLDEFGFIE